MNIFKIVSVGLACIYASALWAKCSDLQTVKQGAHSKSLKRPLPSIGQSFISGPGDVANNDDEGVQDIPNQRDYKTIAACHIYSKHTSSIYKGQLPPNLPGIGIVETTVNHRGDVSGIEWIRKPADLRFVAMTEKYIRDSAPYPAPGALGTVVHREIWLWTHGNLFQLDSVTEGQQ
jgi:hypothetical protein